MKIIKFERGEVFSDLPFHFLFYGFVTVQGVSAVQWMK